MIKLCALRSLSDPPRGRDVKQKFAARHNKSACTHNYSCLLLTANDITSRSDMDSLLSRARNTKHRAGGKLTVQHLCSGTTEALQTYIQIFATDP